MLTIFFIALLVAIISGAILIGSLAIKVVAILLIIAVIKKIYQKFFAKKEEESL